jgi:hypothetical protein
MRVLFYVNNLTGKSHKRALHLRAFAHEAFWLMTRPTDICHARVARFGGEAAACGGAWGGVCALRTFPPHLLYTQKISSSSLDPNIFLRALFNHHIYLR